jgi:peptidoglycan/xylan/chitin deacetylase (PgdA/CDA1 family)
MNRLTAAMNRWTGLAAPGRRFMQKGQAPLVSFTFDDFPQSAADVGAPLLEKHGAHGTFYIAGGLSGGEEGGVPVVRTQDLLPLTQRGHEIGCHTYSHIKVSQASRRTLEEEVERNAKFALEAMGDIRLASFAYPFGDLSWGAKSVLQRRYASCRTTTSGLNHGVIDAAALRAERLYSRTTSPERVKALIAQAAHQKAWLIFYTHDISAAPSDFGCPPELLALALETCVAAGIEILPVKNALARMAFGE